MVTSVNLFLFVEMFFTTQVMSPVDTLFGHKC